MSDPSLFYAELNRLPVVRLLEQSLIPPVSLQQLFSMISLPAMELISLFLEAEKRRLAGHFLHSEYFVVFLLLT